MFKISEFSKFSRVPTKTLRYDYDTFEQSYAVLAAWIEANNYRVVGHPREIYLSPPEEGKLPVTEIQFPVEKG